MFRKDKKRKSFKTKKTRPNWGLFKPSNNRQYQSQMTDFPRPAFNPQDQVSNGVTRIMVPKTLFLNGTSDYFYKVLLQYVRRHRNSNPGALPFIEANVVTFMYNYMQLLGNLHMDWQLGNRFTDMNGETIWANMSEQDDEFHCKTLSYRKKYTGKLAKYKFPKTLIELVLWYSTARQMGSVIIFPHQVMNSSTWDSYITNLVANYSDFNIWINGTNDIELLQLNIQDFDIDGRIVEDPEWFALFGLGPLVYTNGSNVWSVVANSQQKTILTNRWDLILMREFVFSPPNTLGSALTYQNASPLSMQFTNTTLSGIAANSIPYMIGNVLTDGFSIVLWTSAQGGQLAKFFYGSQNVYGGPGTNYLYYWNVDKYTDSSVFDVSERALELRWNDIVEIGIPINSRISSIAMNVIGKGKREDDNTPIKQQSNRKSRSEIGEREKVSKPTNVDSSKLDESKDSDPVSMVADRTQDKRNKNKDAY